jgi:hypothetical protein
MCEARQTPKRVERHRPGEALTIPALDSEVGYTRAVLKTEVRKKRANINMKSTYSLFWKLEVNTNHTLRDN